MLSGRTQWPQYFLAAHAACFPFSPFLYASANCFEQVANLPMDHASICSHTLSFQTVKCSKCWCLNSKRIHLENSQKNVKLKYILFVCLRQCPFLPICTKICEVALLWFGHFSDSLACPSRPVGLVKSQNVWHIYSNVQLKTYLLIQTSSNEKSATTDLFQVLILVISWLQNIIFMLPSKAFRTFSHVSLFVTLGHVIRTVHECGLS